MGKLDLRANGARHWSQVDAIPGPDNRLAEQARISANLGAELRWSDAFSASANLHWQYSGRARLSAALASDTGPVRTLDLSALWRTATHTRLRLSLANALHPERHSAQAFDDGRRQSARSGSASAPAVLRLLVEHTL